MLKLNVFNIYGLKCSKLKFLGPNINGIKLRPQANSG